jgi:hypothetical protein
MAEQSKCMCGKAITDEAKEKCCGVPRYSDGDEHCECDHVQCVDCQRQVAAIRREVYHGECARATVGDMSRAEREGLMENWLRGMADGLVACNSCAMAEGPLGAKAKPPTAGADAGVYDIRARPDLTISEAVAEAIAEQTVAMGKGVCPGAPVRPAKGSAHAVRLTADATEDKVDFCCVWCKDTFPIEKHMWRGGSACKGCYDNVKSKHQRALFIDDDGGSDADSDNDDDTTTARASDYDSDSDYSGHHSDTVECGTRGCKYHTRNESKFREINGLVRCGGCCHSMFNKELDDLEELEEYKFRIVRQDSSGPMRTTPSRKAKRIAPY